MTRLLFLSLFSAVVFTGCSSVYVNTDYDESVDFSRLKTYAWQHETQPQTGNPRIDNDLIDNRVRAAVDAELRAKGFVPAENREEADVLVAYFIDFKQRIGGSSISFGIGAGTYNRYGGIGYDTSVSDYEEGHLTIDIINPATDKNIWRGVGRRTSYESSDPKRITRVINDSVSKILKKFPPKS